MHEMTIAWIQGVMGQAAAGPIDAAAVDAVKVQSVWDFVVKGGLMMIPIGVFSMVAVTVFVERLISLRRSRVLPAGFLPGVKPLLDNGLEDRARALEYCENDGSPIARVFAFAIKRLGEPIEVIERSIQTGGERVVFELRKFSRVLAVIAATAPLLGLLGTIFGMINAFQTVASSGEALGKTELLAGGIYEAMITTAAGLMVAIPTLIAHHWVSARVDYLVADMDQMTIDFVEEYGRARAEADRTHPRLRAIQNDPADCDDSLGGETVPARP